MDLISPEFARRDLILELAKELATETLAGTMIVESDRDWLVLEAGMAIGIQAALQHADNEKAAAVNMAVAVERAAARMNRAWAASF